MFGYRCLSAIFLFVALEVPCLLRADTINVGSPATSTTLTISDTSLTNLGYNQVTAYIDPYHGTFDGNQVLLFCVDPDHFDGTGPYTVNVSPNGTGSQTEQVIFHGDSPSQAAGLYDEEAYLSRLLSNTPTSQVITQQEIQGAIWQLADSTVTFPGASSAFNSAVASYESAAKVNPVTSGFEILTDSACTTASNCLKTRQEYLVLVPEPGTLAFLGTGLLAIFRSIKKAV